MHAALAVLLEMAALGRGLDGFLTIRRRATTAAQRVSLLRLLRIRAI